MLTKSINSNLCCASFPVSQVRKTFSSYWLSKNQSIFAAVARRKSWSSEIRLTYESNLVSCMLVEMHSIRFRPLLPVFAKTFTFSGALLFKLYFKNFHEILGKQDLCVFSTRCFVFTFINLEHFH